MMNDTEHTDDARNWTEDFSHENGNYLNTCVECNQHFIGHKRRVVCKLCHKPAAQPRDADLEAARAAGLSKLNVSGQITIEEINAYDAGWVAHRDAAGYQSRTVEAVCGENRIAGMGCGRVIEHQNLIFRCYDCEVAFHRGCLQMHFKNQSIGRCHICGTVCDIYPDPPAVGTCYEHCPDHDYKTEDRETRCQHCNMPAPDSYYDRD